jgi:flagellar M-ring protein FliF
MAEPANTSTPAKPGAAAQTPQGVLAQLARSGRMRIVAALVVTALVGGGLGVIMLRGGDSDLKLLYSGLDLQEAAAISGRLDTAGIKNEVQGGGSAVFVDAAKVDDARMMLSQDGLPTRGSVGWEIFDRSDALGETTFTQNVRKVRALEGELGRTISSLDNVQSSRVHLVLPERTVFQRENETPAKATVVVSLAGAQLKPENIRAIRNVVATAVPGLEVNNITLVDDRGRLYAAGGEHDEAGGGGGSIDERRVGMEETLRRKVMEIVENIAGVGAARVQVSADMDFNRVTQTSDTFDPDSRVVRGQTTIEETNSNRDTPPGNTTSVAANVPGGAASPDPSPTSQASGSHNEETVNYEINRTQRTEIMEGGRIKRLSVAVAIDDVRAPGADANAPPTFTPRTPEELQRIEALVKSAVGFVDTEQRHDTVSVVNISFARPDIPPADVKPPGPFDFDKFDLVRILEIAALLVTGLALVWFVLRPLVKGLMTRDEDQAGGAVGAIAGPGGKKGKGKALPAPDNDAGAEGPGGTRIVNAAGSGNGRVAIPDGTSHTISIPMDERLDAGVDVARISGQVRASSIKKISEVVNQHPDESISIIRSWLAEEGGERA